MPLLQATMIYAGFYTELLSCNPLNPIKLTMVSLDTVDIIMYPDMYAMFDHVRIVYLTLFA